MCLDAHDRLWSIVFSVKRAKARSSAVQTIISERQALKLFDILRRNNN